VEGLLSCLTRKTATVISLAAPEGISFTAFLHEIARGRTNRFPLFVPVPVLLIRVIAGLVGSKLSSKLGLEQLRSLFALRHMNTIDDLQSLALTLRSLSAGMTRSGYGRRALIREGRVLLTYVLRTKPAGALVRRYVRAVETLRANLPLHLPEIFVAAPALLALIDGSTTIDKAFRSEFDWRINAALMIAEASPQGAIRFLDIENTGSWIRGAVIVGQAGLMELGIRILRLFLMPLLYLVGRRGVFR
jgi:NADH dehydrogenase